MKKAYPVFIKKDSEFFIVFVPDMNIYTQGRDLEEAIEMARDVIGMQGIALKDMGEKIPKPSTYKVAIKKAKEIADENIDYSTGILTLVDIDFKYYFRNHFKKNKKRKIDRIVNLINSDWIVKLR